MSQLLEFLQKNPILGIVAPAVGKLIDYTIGMLTDSVLMEILGSLSLIVGLSVAVLAGISHVLTIREKLINIRIRKK